MEIDSKDDTQSVKREWKEVQLKISETGVMSVTDISNLDTKKSTKAKEINQEGSLEQSESNSDNVNKLTTKAEEKEPVKSSKNKKSQQDNLNKRKFQDEKASNASKSESKSEGMELKSIDQWDISKELVKNEKSENKNLKSSNDSVQAENNRVQAENTQEKIKLEPTSLSADKCSETKQNSTKNNLPNNDINTEIALKQNLKSSGAGSKINALSAKLQFQPKVGQVSNTYSKKSSNADKKIIPSSPVKITDLKSLKTSVKSEVKDEVLSASKDSKQSTIGSISIPTYCQSTLTKASSASTTYVTAPSGPADTKISQVLSTPSTESLASIGLHVSTTMSNQTGLNNWLTDRSSKTSSDKDISADQQLRSLPGIPQLGKEIVCSTTAASPANSMVAPRFSIQTPSMSIYSITTSLKNNVYPSGTHSYSSSPSKQQTTSKLNFDQTGIYPIPPCPDGIPIGSLMKQGKPVAKGSMVNEICAKISSGSKINEICAKIGENSKEKNKIVPDLLKISKKNNAQINECVTTSIKHIPNIPNVPIYTPSNSQAMQIDNVKKLVSSCSNEIKLFGFYFTN